MVTPEFPQFESFDYSSDLFTVNLQPKEPSVKCPVLFVLGWNAKLADYNGSFNQLVNTGRRVLSMETKGTEDKKTDSLIKFIDSKGVGEADLIAHSVGSISSVLLAAKIPKRIRHLVMLNPASMLGNDSERDLIGRYKAMFQSMGVAPGGEVSSRRSILEMAKTINKFDMYALRAKLQSLGVRVSSIHALADTLFPSIIVAAEANLRKLIQNEDFYLADEGDHLDIAPLIPRALCLLEAK